jgi:hypothetical protein
LRPHAPRTPRRATLPGRHNSLRVDAMHGASLVLRDGSTSKVSEGPCFAPGSIRKQGGRSRLAGSVSNATLRQSLYTYSLACGAFFIGMPLAAHRRNVRVVNRRLPASRTAPVTGLLVAALHSAEMQVHAAYLSRPGGQSAVICNGSLRERVNQRL